VVASSSGCLTNSSCAGPGGAAAAPVATRPPRLPPQNGPLEGPHHPLPAKSVPLEGKGRPQHPWRRGHLSHPRKTDPWRAPTTPYLRNQCRYRGGGGRSTRGDAATSPTPPKRTPGGPPPPPTCKISAARGEGEAAATVATLPSRPPPQNGPLEGTHHPLPAKSVPLEGGGRPPHPWRRGLLAHPPRSGL